MQLKIDLQALDDGIEQYKEIIADLQDCQSQMEAVIMDLSSCWTGVHAATAMLRLAALECGKDNSLAKIQDQAQGILQTLEVAREGMNREKNRCDHFPDMVADPYASSDMQYPDVRESGSNLLFIDYDRSAALVDTMDEILDNELSLERRRSGQMGRWKTMFDGIDGQIRHTRINLRAEDSSATWHLREQHQKLYNFKQVLTRYHLNLAGLEQDIAEAFLGYDRYQQEMEARAIYQTAGPGQEMLVMTGQEFLKDAIDGRLLCDWGAIARVLQKKELSAKELAGLCDVLDRIAALPEQERNAMIYTFLSNCDLTSGATGQLFQGYRGTLGLLAAKAPEDISRYPLSNEAYMMRTALSKYIYAQKNEQSQTKPFSMKTELPGTVNLKDYVRSWTAERERACAGKFRADLEWELGSEKAVLTMVYEGRRESHTFRAGAEGAWLNGDGDLIVSDRVLNRHFLTFIQPPSQLPTVRDNIKFGLEVGALYAGGRLLLKGGKYIMTTLPGAVSAAEHYLTQPTGWGMQVAQQQVGNGTKALNVLNDGLTWGGVVGAGAAVGLAESWLVTVNYAKGTTGLSEGADNKGEAKAGKTKGEDVKFGSNTKSEQKLNSQMNKRGWTKQSVRDTVDSPYTTRTSTNKAAGNPSTVYYTKEGSYVIVDDVTKEIVQVSDNINPSTWAPDASIVNPYIPE